MKHISNSFQLRTHTYAKERFYTFKDKMFQLTEYLRRSGAKRSITDQMFNKEMLYYALYLLLDNFSLHCKNMFTAFLP